MKVKSKKWIEREKLKEWRKKCLERDSYTCQICKRQSGGNLHIAHVLPKEFKEFKELKYDVMNGITCCFRNHKVGVWSIHLNPLFFVLFLKKHKPKQYEYLTNKLLEIDKNANRYLQDE